jgi:hypothetical protein
VAWKLCAMCADDVTATLDPALSAAGLDHVTVNSRRFFDGRNRRRSCQEVDRRRPNDLARKTAVGLGSGGVICYRLNRIACAAPRGPPSPLLVRMHLRIPVNQIKIGHSLNPNLTGVG